MEETDAKIIKLEQSMDKVFQDINELKVDFKQVQGDLSTWFGRVDASVQELKLSQTKMEEQAKSRGFFEQIIRDQLAELKGFQAKLLLALAGGGISLIVWLIQDLFSH